MITRRNKYRAVRTPYNGRIYDSKAEAARAAELDLLVKAGVVAWWLPQVPVMIGEPGVDKPWRLDFLVAEWACNSLAFGEPVVIHGEDVKGAETASFRRHVKQWRLRGKFPLHIIRGKKIEIITREDA